MIKILEVAWLIITIVTLTTALWQFFDEGIQSAIWMLVVSAVAFAMYMIRKKQRIRNDMQQQQQHQEEAARYH
jgi:hypothetical protein